MVDELDPRSADVIRRHYGLDGEEPETLNQLADRMGVSPERIRQIEHKALRKMRHPSRAHRILAALPRGPLKSTEVLG